jgi:hypothetical protein
MKKEKLKQQIETKEKENFIFSIIGFKAIDYNGKVNCFEFIEPMKNKEGIISYFDPIGIVIFKRALKNRLNKELDKKIKGIISFKIKIVGTGEEKWI